jgi:antitoxin component of RelBE/YafQ-DinJ toxin-antitoxin module
MDQGVPTSAGRPVTYTTNIRLDDDQADAIKAYAKDHGGITIAAAIRILLAQALKENRHAHASSR